jgi:protein phosphatase PTC7
MIAVADGVGGWNDYGVDPGIFSRELCGHVKEGYEKQLAHAKERYEIDLKRLLVEGVKATKAKGSSTFVMAMIDN